MSEPRLNEDAPRYPVGGEDGPLWGEYYVARHSKDPSRIRAARLAIEEQAATEARRELLAKVEGLPELTLGLKGGVSRAAVLALLAPSEKGARG